MAEKHGRELVDMLKESSAELKYAVQLLPREREVGSYILQIMHFNYGGDNVALVLVKGEMRHKKHDPIAHYNLAVVNLGKEGINPRTIEELIRQNVEGMPHLPVLRTAEYIIAEGDAAKGSYEHLLETKPPTTANDFATQLGEYRRANTWYNHPNAEALFSPRLRLRLGRR